MGLLYTKLKIFHYQAKIDSLPQQSKDILPPVHIRIKPTNACGHNCWYCAYKADNLQLGKDMNKRDFIPKEKMAEILDDLVEMGVKAVTFSGGGDPLYYPYLLDAVKKLAQTPIKFASLTNGSRLQGEVAEIFAHRGTWLRISIDGWDDESYARYRNVKVGEFTKVMNNIESFKNLGGKCYLSISLIVDKENAGHVYEFIRRLKNMGVNSVKVSPCIVSNDGAVNNAYHQPIFDQVKESTRKAVADFSDGHFEIFDSYHALDDKFKKDYDWCPYLQILPVIGADLNIYPCQDKAYNLEDGLIGTIKNQRFKDFWFSDKNKFLKINPSVNCNHHCIANEKNKMVLEYLYADSEHLSFV
ncbi:MAG: radical SAM protein [Planctomycetes bacterium RIFCSPLOWO2_12_38_17]|nr:MAG: radical SAM protein [Planctomycetes bacterium RIFCSPLOWO2_12_38_17]